MLVSTLSYFYFFLYSEIIAEISASIEVYRSFFLLFSLFDSESSDPEISTVLFSDKNSATFYSSYLKWFLRSLLISRMSRYLSL